MKRELTPVCPYFRYETPRYLTCEGGSRVSFAEHGTFKDYERTYCASLAGYCACTIAQALNASYARKEEKHAGVRTSKD